MNIIGIIEGIKNFFAGSRGATSYKMVNQAVNQLSLWGNAAYDNDVVRACVVAKANRIAKCTLKHVQRTVTSDGKKRININPWPYMRFMLEKPNRYMNLKDFLFKLSIETDLNGNAFILILRDSNGVPCELLPVPCSHAEVKFHDGGSMLYEFVLKNGTRWRFAAEDIIHQRGDYYLNDIFGDSKMKAIKPLTDVIETTDAGIISAIKNSAIVRWLLKFTTPMRPEDLKKNAKEFAENFLALTAEGTGVAATDSKAEAKQVNPQEYVPNAAQMAMPKGRIMALFHSNEKIITSTANEDEENAYYEAVIEPWLISLAQNMTYALFSRRQIGTGNAIMAGSFNLQAASLKTKLALVSMVDRGAMLVDEWREALGLEPVPGGDVPIRRLDTAAVESTPAEGGEEDAESD